MNSIYCIHPYQWNGLWVFDDPVHGLTREPFVAGANTVIDLATQAIPHAEEGFNLLFSASPFPPMHQDAQTLELKLKEESPTRTGSTYVCEQFGLEAWLCPALYRYYERAPAYLFAQFLPDPKPQPHKKHESKKAKAKEPSYYQTASRG